MKRIKNENVQREYKNKLFMLFLGIVLLIVAFGCKQWEINTIKNANKDVKDLNTIILSEGEKTDKKAYLYVYTNPYKFAVYDDTTDSYYIVADDKYMYVVYMSVSDFELLNKDDIDENPIRVEGVTKETTRDIKQLAIDVYNEGLDESEQLSIADYNNYFGEVYLDLTVGDSTVATISIICFWLTFIFGIILILVGLIETVGFQNTIKNLDATIIDDLNNEMNDKDAFYYQKAHLYLTRNYIINFGGKFIIIPYEDLLWMYKFEHRTNGIKTAQSIRVLTDKGKTYNIANIDVVTKKAKNILEEIWETIVSKNDKILLGYTKENIKVMKKKVKEIKKSK